MRRLHTLLKNSSTPTYAVADAAILDGLLEPMYALGPRAFSCLLMGEVEPDVAHVAPYLIELKPELPLIDWLEQKLDLPWGYLVESSLSARQLHLHLRKFSEIRGMDGETLFFRFWDPRVMNSMTKIFSTQQSECFMQGITRIRLLATNSNFIINLQWNEPAQKMERLEEPLFLMEARRHVAV